MTTRPHPPITGRLRSVADLGDIESVPWPQRIPATNTYTLLRDACRRHHDRIALRLLHAGAPDADVRSISYGGLLAGVHRTANALHALGVRPKVPVAILLPNLIETHFALWGSQAAGIAIPINPMLEDAYIARICAETGVQVVIALGPAPGSSIWSKAVRVAEQVPSIHTLLQVDMAAALGARASKTGQTVSCELPMREGIRVLDFHGELANVPSAALVSGRVFEASEHCAYFHTGGTTGYPKVAIHTHLNEAFLSWIAETFYEPDNVLLSGLPLFHVNGALVTGLAAFHCGFEVVMLTPGGFRTPGVVEHLWTLVQRFNATGFSTVPTILAALIHRPFPVGGLPTLRRVICGAAVLPRQVAVDFERATGLQIHEGYGLTEGTCVSTLNPLLGERRLGSVGIRLPYQELRVFRVDSDLRAIEEMGPSEIGVIGIKGPNVFPGYLRESDNRGIWLAEGWLNTGDLGRLDDQGYLTLCGRAKELIIRGGHNIDPALIEDALVSHAAVAQVAAVGQPDRHAGELPIAFVALKPGAHATVGELQAHAAHAVPERAAVPVRIEILPALPLTAVGKIAKPALRLRAIDHALNQALAEQGLSEVHATARLCAERGTIVDLEGPATLRERALALGGQYPVIPEWKGACE
ncbi:MAG: acyl-CoA synthetase [Steroidobacteraceae bacterium]|jgi:fatty-acyl-CoA synthase